MTIGQSSNAVVLVETESDGSSQADRGEKMPRYATAVKSLDEGGSVEEAVPGVRTKGCCKRWSRVYEPSDRKDTHHETLYTLKK